MTILCQEVANANPIDGICLELAELFDQENTGECTYDQLISFLEIQHWLGADEVELRKQIDGILGMKRVDFSKNEKLRYRELFEKVIS